MQSRKLGLLFVMAFVSLGADAETKITEQERIVTATIPKPDQIWVHDLVATPSDVPADSILLGELSGMPSNQTDEQIAEGRKLGAEIAAELVQNIQAMGMPAGRPTATTKPAINDLVIRGYLISVSEGDRKKRVAVGLGSGESEIKVAMEGFQMTDQGLRPLGKGAADSKGGKTPGIAAAGIATVAMHNPIGLLVSTGIKTHGEKTGSATVEGRAKDTAKTIADALEKRFQEQGWIQK